MLYISSDMLNKMHAIVVPKRKLKVTTEVKKEIAKFAFYGIALDKKIYTSLDLKELSSLRKKIVGTFKLDTNHLVETAFHKSFSVIKKTPELFLKLQQLIHYITSYYTALEEPHNDPLHQIPSADKVYVPKEITKGLSSRKVSFLYIKGYYKEEFEELLRFLFYQSFAYQKDYIDLLVKLMQDMKVEIDVNSIKNRDLLSVYVNHNPHLINDLSVDEFLRYIVTGISGLSFIKNTYVLKSLEEKLSDKKSEVSKLIEGFVRHKISMGAQYDLALSFRRNKDIWLTIKKATSKKARNAINQVSHLSNNVKSIEKMYLDSEIDYNNRLNIITNFTKFVSRGLPAKKALADLSKADAPLLQLLRLLDALHYRVKTGTHPKQFIIRSGAVFTKDYSLRLSISEISIFMEAEQMIRQRIISKLSKIKDKYALVIPSNVDYPLPTSAKNMLGGIPTGTIVTFKRSRNLIIGVWWRNLESSRIDIDLSFVNMRYKVGWNGNHSNTDKNIFYSGDMTDAPRPNGASEYLLITDSADFDGVLSINLYTNRIGQKVPFRFFIQNPTDSTVRKMLSLHKETSQISLLVRKGNILNKDLFFDEELNEIQIAHVKGTKDSIKVQFILGRTRETISSANNQINASNKELRLKPLLEEAGFKIYEKTEKVPKGLEILDLSLHNIDEKTMLKLLGNL